MEAGRSLEAEREYREAIQLAPDDYLHFYNYACFLAKERRDEEMYRNLKRALELAPNMNARAATDPDFEPYRGADRFQEMVAFRRKARDN